VSESRQAPSRPMAESRSEADSRPRAQRPRRSRISLLLALVALVPSLLAAVVLPQAAAADTPPTVPPRPLRVATYNIHHGVGLDGMLDLERTARQIEATGVEVVGLQEVDRHWSERSNFVDQASWLAERLGMHVVYGANLDRDPLTPGAERRQYGTAILSSYKFRSWTNTLLPRPLGGEQRGLLEAVIKVRGLDVRVFNTHLQHDSQVERLAQVAQVRQIVGQATESVVLLGDLNATPESQEIGQITQDLVDAWITAGVGPGYTYDAASPHARIDYVLTSAGIVARTAAVVTTDTSDHLPVVADLALPGGRPTGR
jgi:endonuclease/exonuclease/phosphatase family metal-dependent hydrolase